MDETTPKIERPQNPTPEIKARINQLTRLMTLAEYQLHEAEKRLASFRSDYQNSNPHIYALGLRQEQSSVDALLQRVKFLKIELSLLRPPISSDIDYRKELVKRFYEVLKKNTVENESLRFHGTSLVSALDIIDSGSISASAERGLGDSSFDVSGQISVTDVESVDLSIKDYIAIKDVFLPMGCLFVLLPKDHDDAVSVRSYLMKSTKIFSEGRCTEQFVRILTSPEALPLVRERLKKNGYPEDFACDFLSFKYGKK